MTIQEEEEELTAELQAINAVYGGDCSVLRSSPPLLYLRLIPRTADLTSQQFVEAVIEIQASSEYPKEPPQIGLVDSKGLDSQRQNLLLNCVRDKATELSSCSMLVALCEEAVERLSLMNHPDGDCPLCLYPLVVQDEKSQSLPFMKLMSCFHCFHCECFNRLWNWLQTEQKDNLGGSTDSIRHNDDVKDEMIGNCPVCRAVFHMKDIEHGLGLVNSFSSELRSDEIESEDDKKLLNSDSENTRRAKFEATLKLQEENSGLIEPKRHISVVPGMYLPLPAADPNTEAKESDEHEAKDKQVASVAQIGSSSSSHCPRTRDQRKPRTRKPRPRNTRKQDKQWIQKEETS